MYLTGGTEAMMIEIKCETVGEKRKVSVMDGASLIYAIEVPLSGKATEHKLDVALLTHTRNELWKRQGQADEAIRKKLKELEG